LFVINRVSKGLQNIGVDLSMEITFLKEFLQNFGENRFASSKEMVQKFCHENGVPPAFKWTGVPKR
jgi:hypothetical protein